MTNPIRILLVDDSPYFLEAARDFLHAQESLTVVGVATEGNEALTQSQELEPDIILLDLNLARSSGLELIPVFKENLPGTRVIVLTMMEETSYRAAALQMGADGFVHKSTMSKTLISAILKAMEGSDAPKIANEIAGHGEVKFMRLVEHLPDLIYRYEITPKRGYTYVSPAITALTGYTSGEYYADPDLELKLVHPEDRPTAEAVLQGKTDPNYPIVLRWIRKDDRIIWTEQRNVNIFDEAGELVAIEGIVRDITERRQAEGRIRESEEKYRLLTENVSDVIWILDLQTAHFRYVSPSVEQLRGYSAEEVMAQEVSSALTPASNQKLAQILPERLAEFQQGIFKSHVDEVEQPCKNGTTVWTEVTTRFLTNPETGALEVYGVSRDITKRKQAEEALRASERKFRSIIEDITELICRFLPDGTLTYVNDAYCRYYGKSREELIGTNFVSNGSDDFPQKHREYFQSFTPDQPISTFEQNDILPNGEKRCREWVDRAIFDEQGRLVEFQSTGRDITERKQVEEQLRFGEEQYRSLFEDSPVALWLEDFSGAKQRLDALKKNGVEDISDYLRKHPDFVAECAKQVKILDVNTAATQLYHARQKNELLGNLVDVLPNLPLEQFEIELIHIAEGRLLFEWEETDHTLTNEKIDVSLRWLVAPGYEDSLARVIVSTMDITERKRAEQNLQEAEAKYRTLVEQIPVAVYTWELGERGICHYISPNIETMLGFPVEEWLTDRDLFFRQVHPHDRERAFAAENHSRDSGEPLHTEFRMSTRDGRIIWVRDESAILPGDTSQPRLSQGILIDITERKRAEEERERLLSTLEASLNEIYMFALDTLKFEYVNAGAIRNLGYTFEQLKTMTPLDLKPEFTEKSFREMIGPLLRREKDKHIFQTVHRRSDASLYPVEVHLQLVEQERQSVFLAVILDITERKRAEETLRRNEAELRSLFASMQDVVILYDREGRYLSIAPTSTPLLYKPPTEMIGKTLHEVLPVAQADLLLANVRRALDTQQTVTLDYRLILGEKEYWFAGAISPITREQVILVAHDVTERKQAEERIKTQLERLASLRAIDTAIISSTDLEMTFYILLTQAIARLKVDAASVLIFNSVTNELEVKAAQGFRTPDLQEVRIHMGKEIAGRCAFERVVLEEHRLTQANLAARAPLLADEDFTCYTAVPLISKGKLMGVLEVFEREHHPHNRDWVDFLNAVGGQAIIAIDNFQLFEGLQRSNAELEQRVAVRTVELERALRVKDEFLANMSHELRTPLNAIIGLSETLEEQTANLLNEKQQRYLHTIYESGHHLLDLINDILDLAKIDANQFGLQRDWVEIRQVAQASLRMIQQMAQKNQQEVTLEIDGQLDVIHADTRRLKQMLVNLLSNAVKFTPEHGRIGLEIRGNRGENKITFTVWDTGIGIKDEDRARLFHPFVQLDSDLARKATGTGLGLALVAQLARLHGGSVSVESQPNQGSRFSIALPWETHLTADTQSRLKSSGKFRVIKPPAQLQKRTVLLVEDISEVSMVIGDYLEYAGYKVEIARNGMEGIAHAKKIHPDLILMDVQMPDMDGLEATRQLRSDAEFEHTPIIALTALAMKGDRERCLAAGMDEYVSKPVHLKSLVKMIRGFLSPEEQR